MSKADVIEVEGTVLEKLPNAMFKVELVHMRIIGIDPGYAIVGYGVLDYEKTRFSVVNYGAITTAAGTMRTFSHHSENLFSLH